MYLARDKRIFQIYQWPAEHEKISNSICIEKFESEEICIYCNKIAKSHGSILVKDLDRRIICPQKYIIIYNNMVIDILNKEDLNEKYEII